MAVNKYLFNSLTLGGFDFTMQPRRQRDGRDGRDNSTDAKNVTNSTDVTNVTDATEATDATHVTHVTDMTDATKRLPDFPRSPCPMLLSSPRSRLRQLVSACQGYRFPELSGSELPLKFSILQFLQAPNSSQP